MNAIFELIKAYGIDKNLLFEEKNKDYLKFEKEIMSKEKIKDILNNSKGFIETDKRMKELLLRWFSEHSKEIKDLRNSKRVHELKEEGFRTIEKVFPNNKVLDNFKIRGIFINWWDENKFDLKTISESGWVQALVSNFDFNTEDKKEIEDNIEKIKYFFKDAFDAEINKVQELEQKEIGLISELDELTQTEESLEEDEEPEPVDKLLKREIIEVKAELNDINKLDLSKKEHTAKLTKILEEKEAELKVITDKKKELKEIKKQINSINASLLTNVQKLIETIKEEEAERMVLLKLQDSAMKYLDSYLTAQKQKIICYFENLWDKYAVSFQELETKKEKTIQELNKYLRGLKYYD